MTPSRRWLLLIVFVLTLALVPLGCGGDDDEGDGASEDVSGSISIMGIWTGEQQKDFQEVLDGFKEKYPDVTVRYNPVGDNLPTVLSTAVEGGRPPDIAAPAQPGLIEGFVEQGAAKPLDFLEETAKENYNQSALDAGSVDGKLYGLIFKANNKSTVFYNVKAFEDAGVEPAEDWEAFLQSAETIKASGVPAYSIGGADGWTLTDLFENIYIRTAGVEKYDQLSKHEIPWTDQSVKDALTEMAKIVGDTDNIVGGRAGALQTDFNTSVSNVFSENPKGAIVIEGDFTPGVVEHPLEPDTGYKAFEFPSIEGSAPAVVTAGNLFVMFTDNGATRAFMEYVATPEAAEIWAKKPGSGFASPNKNVDESVYPDEVIRTTATALANAENFRFDLSDLVPAAFGATQGQGLWKLFQDFISNPQDVDGIAKKMEQAAAAASN